MRIIHLLRKPLSEGTVASNVLKHGCGGLNIDVSRISTEDNLNGGAYAETPTNQRRGRSNLPGDSRKGAAAGMFQPGSTASTGFVPPTGRWPANVILQHLDGCRCEGTKRVPSNGNFPAQQKTTSWKMASKGKALTPDRTYRQGGGETVSNWICEPGCPVERLDEQSGERPSGGSATTKDRTDSLYEDGLSQRIITPYNDTGGASRFYKQVGGEK